MLLGRPCDRPDSKQRPVAPLAGSQARRRATVRNVAGFPSRRIGSALQVVWASSARLIFKLVVFLGPIRFRSNRIPRSVWPFPTDESRMSQVSSFDRQP